MSALHNRLVVRAQNLSVDRSDNRSQWAILLIWSQRWVGSQIIDCKFNYGEI